MKRVKLIHHPKVQLKKRETSALLAAIREFNADHDIKDVIEEHTELKCVASTHGGEWCGPCPLEDCDSINDALRVWPFRESDNGNIGSAWCRKCDRCGDSLRWSMMLDGFDPSEKGQTPAYLKEGEYLDDNQP